MGTDKGYTGQFQDAATGLDYYNARYYDPVMGQFLSADHVQGNAQGFDPYSYVGENPETATDPTGQRISCPPDCGNTGSGGSGGTPCTLGPNSGCNSAPLTSCDSGFHLSGGSCEQNATKPPATKKPTTSTSSDCDGCDAYHSPQHQQQNPPSCGKQCQHIRAFAEGGANQFRALASEVQTLYNLVTNEDISGSTSVASFILGLLSIAGKFALGTGIAGIVLSLEGVGSWIWSHLLQDYHSVLEQMAADYDQLSSQYNDSMNWATETGYGRYGTSEIDGFANGELTNLAQREESMHWHETGWSLVDMESVSLFQTYVGVMDARVSINILTVRDQMIGCTCEGDYME